MRNRQMIVRWLMANTKAIEERTRDAIESDIREGYVTRAAAEATYPQLAAT